MALASLARGGGLQVEPWVERVRDFALHGYVSQRGTVTLGAPTLQECDATGAWQRTTRLDPAGTLLSEGDREALVRSATMTADALSAADYFGPFGVDAFSYERDAVICFNARSEINARYSMGWAIGMGDHRPDRDED